MNKQRVQWHLIVECTLHTFGTQGEDQDQTQVEDEVQSSRYDWRSFSR